MAEKLTKTVLKEELRRRIEWYEDRFDFNEDMTNDDFIKKSHTLGILFGRYQTYCNILWQIENGSFKGGYI